VHTIHNTWVRMLLVALMTAALRTPAATILYTLDSVILQDHRQMTGVFSWTYTTNDFENGTGEFLDLDIPWTTHDQDDLHAVFDIGSSIEITLEGSVHDDGVDITLFLKQALSLTNAAALDLTRSKYEIGGNGFHDGVFTNGAIAPTNLFLTVTAIGPGFAEISWSPPLPGVTLQETPILIHPTWTNAPSGTTNPATIPITTRFYRAKQPQTP
jgi:hypothetical protein